MSENTKKTIVLHGSILAAAGIITKIIGFIYRIPMANIIGNEGNGLYSVAFGIYNIALTLSSYSMPLAVSKLMSERIAKNRYKDAHRLFKRAFIFATCTGLIAFAALYFGAETLAVLYKREGLERPLRILAPTTFVVALLGTCRGYFQGHRNMIPTAVSQIVEQIVNAVVSVAAAYGFIACFATEETMASYGAMGGTLGTFCGALAALIIFGGLFIIGKKKRIIEMSGSDEAVESEKIIFKSIVLTVIPVIISQTIYQFGYTVDDLLYGNIMELKGIAGEVATSMQGVFNTQYNTLINLPVAISTSMASATLPSVVASFTVGDSKSVKEKIDTVIKTNMIIAIPSAVGLAVLAEPIMSVLFPGLGEYKQLAVFLLRTGSSAVVFYALSTLTTSVLQGCNRMRIPVIHSGISLAIHIVINGVLLYCTSLNVYALIIGNVTFPLLVALMNIRSVRKLVGYEMKYGEVLVKPFIAAAIMGAAAYGVYTIGMLLAGNELRLTKVLVMTVAIVIAMIVYAVGLIISGTVTKDELTNLPGLRKILKKRTHK